MWLYLGVFSAVFLGFYDITRKHVLHENAVLPVLFFATLTETLLLLPIAILSPLAPELLTRLGLYIPVFGLAPQLHCLTKAIMVSVLWTLGFFAIKNLPISLFAPIASSSPAWTLLGAILLFGERLTTLQWVAFVILFISYYFFSILGSREGIVFHTNKWVIFLFLAVLLASICALYDKYLIHTLRYSAIGVQVWSMFYAVPLLGLATLLIWRPRRARFAKFKWQHNILLIGIFLTISDFAYFKAIACEGALISLLIAVRSSGVVVSFLAGALIFGEVRMRSKAFALAGVLIGIFLLFLSSSH